MNHQPAGIRTDVPPGGTGCADCDAAQPPGWWVHLRRCATCGHIGCCDSSPGRHGSAHARATGHRYIQTFEPGEDWFFDFDTEEVFEGPVLTSPRAHPVDQAVPGPADRLPVDWMSRIHR